MSLCHLGPENIRYRLVWSSYLADLWIYGSFLIMMWKVGQDEPTQRAHSTPLEKLLKDEGEKSVTDGTGLDAKLI